MEEKDREMLQDILNAIGQLSGEIKTLNNKIDLIETKTNEQYDHLVRLVSTQALDIESISQDVSYLVKREADNRHRITLLNKAINPLYK